MRVAALWRAPSTAGVRSSAAMITAGAAAAAHFGRLVRPAAVAIVVVLPVASRRRRCFHSFPARSAVAPLLSTQTHDAAKAWNLAARLGSLEELGELSAWLGAFRRDAIPAGTFQLAHARSSGKGGQNVNKVNTKVDMRFRLSDARWLPTLARKCLGEAERGRVNTAGEFVLTSERHRTQGENMADCVDKLYVMIQQSCELPKATDAAKVERIKKLEDVQKVRRRQDKERGKDRKSSRRDWKD